MPKCVLCHFDGEETTRAIRAEVTRQVWDGSLFLGKPPEFWQKILYIMADHDLQTPDDLQKWMQDRLLKIQLQSALLQKQPPT